jgi:hypothetical protein
MPPAGYFCYIGRFAPNPDPLLSASDKSGQKRLSAHFAISENISLRSILVKFEAEPNFDNIFWTDLIACSEIA